MISFFGRKLKPTWSFSPEATIWRLLFGGERRRIVGEARDTEGKRTSFFCLDEASGTPLWQDLRLEEPWWIGLEAVHGDVAILHGYEKPDLPEHKRVMVLDLETGAERWNNPALTFWFAYRDKLVGYEQRFDRRIGHVLDLSSGEILESHEGVEPLFPLRQIARQEDSGGDLVFPEPLQQADLEGLAETKVLSEAGSESQLEGIAGERYLLLSYYRPGPGSVPAAPRLEHRFLIFDRSRNKFVFSETLQQDASAPVPDAFFMREGRVYFVKDQRTLTAIDLLNRGREE